MPRTRTPRGPLHPPARSGPTRPVRIAAFVSLALATALAVFLLWPRTPVATAAHPVTIDMGGFHPASVSVKAGEAIQLIDPDSSMHSDGGGWHQMAIPALRLDEKVGPRSTLTFEVPATAAPGEYAFYCDICCGGKENPSMQGVLKVTV